MWYYILSGKLGILELVETKDYGIEGRYKWRGPSYHMIIYMLCRRYSIWVRNVCLVYKYRIYITYSEYFLFKWSTVCKAKTEVNTCPAPLGRRSWLPLLSLSRACSVQFVITPRWTGLQGPRQQLLFHTPCMKPMKL